MSIFKVRRMSDLSAAIKPSYSDVVAQSKANQQKISAIKKTVGQSFDNIRKPVPFGTQLAK